MNIQKAYKLIFYFTVLGSVILSGCSANTYNAKITEFIEPKAPKFGETSIFVFRENSAFGSARKFAIICNDTVMGVLTTGTFCQFNVKSAENEIVAYMSAPIMHYRIQDRPGENVYLFCKMGYTTGMFIEEIDKVTADSLMNEFKYMEIDVKNKKTDINYKSYYDKLYQ
jgi:hypothetical protein